MSIEKFANMINECNNIVFFGGAGISTESGVKDYRSEDGLYNTAKDYGVSPETILSIDFFEEHPDVFYDFYRKYFTMDVEPNKAHTALADSVIETNILFFCLASGAVLGQHYKTKQSIRRNCIYTLDVIDGFTGEILLSAPYQRIKINKGKTQIVLD